MKRTHLTPFRESGRPYLVLLRNAVPVVGVYWFGWPAGVIVFQIWWDGVSTLATSMALHLHAALRNDPAFFESDRFAFTRTPVGRLLNAGLIWLFALLLLGTPYWFVFVAIGSHYDVGASLGPLLRDPMLLGLLGLVLLGNAVEEAMRGYHRMTETEARREFDWDFHMHLARVALMLMATFFFAGSLVVGFALVLSYVEIYPMRALRLLGGDDTLDEKNRLRSPD